MTPPDYGISSGIVPNITCSITPRCASELLHLPATVYLYRAVLTPSFQHAFDSSGRRLLPLVPVSTTLASGLHARRLLFAAYPFGTLHLASAALILSEPSILSAPASSVSSTSAAPW